MSTAYDMEKSMVVESNRHRIGSVLVSKPVEPAIKIDSISIDLINADEKTDAEKCEHFSIRGYVSEIRKKDWKKCWPFASDGERSKYEKQTCMLPPLHAPNFRFWRCQNCLWEMSAKGTANDYGKVLKSCGTEYKSNGICSHSQIRGNAAKICSDFQQAPTEDIHEGRKVDANASCHFNSPAECPPFSYADKKENKCEASNYPMIGHRMVSEDNLEQDKLRLNHVTLEAISSLMQKTNQTDERAFTSKTSGYTDLCNPDNVHEEAADAECARNLDCKVKSAAKINETGKKTSVDDQHAGVIACGTFSEAGNVDEALSTDKGNPRGHPSLELDEVDHPSSESDETMIRSKQESDHENSSCLHRRKTQKVRLLTELLDGNGSIDTDNMRTEDSLSNANPTASAEVNKFPVSQGQMPPQRKVRRVLGQNRKRKLHQEEYWRPPETSIPNKVCEEVQIMTSDVETIDVVVGSKNIDARLDLQTTTKCHWIKHKRDRNSIIAKKKTKRALISDDFLSFSSSQENMPNDIEDGIGDRSKGNAANDVLIEPVHNAFTATEIDLFPLPAQTIERRPSKGKMPQVDDCHDSQIPWNHGPLSEFPVTGKDARRMQTGPLTAPFHAAQDASHENELKLSLNCYTTAQGYAYDHNYIPLADRRTSLSNWQEGASKDQFMRNTSETNYVGNSNFTSKSAQHALFGKGLHGEMNGKSITYNGLQDASHENGLNLSLNSYAAVQRYEGNHVPQVGGRRISLLNWQEGTSEEDHITRRAAETNYIGNFSFASKSPIGAPFGNGLHSEHRGKRAMYKMPLLNEKQNCLSQFGVRNHSFMQQKDCSASSSHKAIGIQEPSAVKRKSMDQRVGKLCEQGALDDIPMEIVELMAKNQYERCLPDAEYNNRQLDLNNDNSSQTMDFSEIYDHGKLSLVQQETAHQQSPQADGRNGIMKWGENVGPSKQKSVDYFSQADRNRFKLGQLEKTHTPAGFGVFLKRQEKTPSGVQYSVPSSCRQNNSQNCKWSGDLVGKRSSHPSLQASGPCNMCQNIPHQSKEANHLWSSMMPNHMSFVYSIPQKSAGLSSNIDVISHSTGGVHEGNTNRDLDLKFVNQNVANLGKQNRNFGSQMLSRTRAEYPFAGKQGGVELNQKPVGSLDLYSNETIPAMHLLSLMDAGLRSSASVGMDVAPKFLKRPSIESDHDPTELSKLDSVAYKVTNSMKLPLYDYHGKNQLAENPHDSTPAIPTTANTSSFSFRHDKSFKKASAFSSQVSQERENRKLADSHTQNKGSRSQQYASSSGGFGTNCRSLPVHSMQTTPLGASDAVAFPLPLNALENSTKHKLGLHGVSRTAHPQKWSLETEICTINRNPTDFSIPEAGNVYMIAGEDLKFRKPYPCTKGSGSIKLDGHKRQRKLHTVKEHSRHLIS